MMRNWWKKGSKRFKKEQISNKVWKNELWNVVINSASVLF